MSAQSKGWGGKDGPPPLTVRKPLKSTVFDWMDRGECTKPEYDDVNFFPPMEQRIEVEKAKSVCKNCPVFIDCLEFAIVNDFRFGIWGGKTPSERGHMEEDDDT